jgi:hypothetical protein
MLNKKKQTFYLHLKQKAIEEITENKIIVVALHEK